MERWCGWAGEWAEEGFCEVFFPDESNDAGPVAESFGRECLRLQGPAWQLANWGALIRHGCPAVYAPDFLRAVRTSGDASDATMQPKPGLAVELQQV